MRKNDCETRQFSVLKVLVAVDGSESSGRAVGHVLKLAAAAGQVELHLLNVQIPVDSGHARMFVSQDEIEAYHLEEGRQCLERAQTMLEEAGVPYSQHVVVGHVAETIAKFAREHQFDLIVMGTHGRSALTHLLMGSVTADVIRLSDRPVTLVK
jgi:nucleotide-binding universal stress UspA family protein